MADETTGEVWGAGVSGEFHSQGAALQAARRLRRDGLPWDRIWLVGEPTTDLVGDPAGFALPASLVRELAWAGALIGALAGCLAAFLLPPQPFVAGLSRLVPWVVLGVSGASAVFAFGGWASRSAKMGAYLQYATAGGLRVKVALPRALPATERERLSELAERSLRAARAESICYEDGRRSINSPQTAGFIA